MTVDYKHITNNNTTVASYRWEGLSMAEPYGKPLDVSGFKDETIQIDGDFDDKSKVIILGSVDGKVFLPVSDKGGNQWKIRKASLLSIGDNVNFIQPFVEDGGESASINVTLNARRVA